METSYSEYEESNTGDFIPPDLDFPPSSIPLKPIEGRYMLIRALGHGSFGTVTLAKSQFNVNRLLSNDNSDLTLMCQDNFFPPNKITHCQSLVAIKTMVTRLKTLRDYKKVREIKFILKMAPNPHLIQIFEIFIDTRKYQLHIVMEYMEQNLYQMMKHRKNKVFSYPSLKSILAQLLVAIKHIHSYNFFHRDIKPENILVTPSSMYFDKQYLKTGDYKDNYVIKLADFGLARNVFNCNSYTPYVSTRWYRSPEILLRNGFYSTPLDMWAFGCVAFELTTFKPLFPGNDELDQVWRILEVLGTPYKSPEFARFNSEPFGGFWKESLLLLNKLNLTLPFAEGISMKTILPNPQLRDLTEVIEQCLKWDPNERVSAATLKDFKFFQNTIIQKESSNEANEISNMQQAMLFAGLNSKSFISRGKTLKINVENEDLEDKEQNNPSIRNHLCTKLPKRRDPNWQFASTNSSNKITSEKLKEEKLTVNEFLKEYKRNDVNTLLDSTIQKMVPSTDAFLESTKLSLVKNNDTYEDLDIDIDDIYDSDQFYKDTYKNCFTRDEMYDTEEEEEIKKELSREIELNLKNSIPREVPNVDDSSILKKCFNHVSCGNLFTVGKDADPELQDLNIQIQQEQMKDFSDAFPTNLEISNERTDRGSMYTGLVNANGTTTNNNSNYYNSDKINPSSYILSKNLQSEIQHRHNNLLDSSFDSSMNITARKYFAENLKEEPFFNLSSSNIIDNIEVEHNKPHEETRGSQFVGNITF